MSCPNIETIKQLWAVSRDLDIPDNIADKAGEEIDRCIPEDLWDSIHFLDLDSPEFEKTFREYPWPQLCAQPSSVVLAEVAKAPAVKRANANPPRTKAKRFFKQPRRVSRAAETWRCLNNYPCYEVSSHGRVRSRDRLDPQTVLKPRWRWYKGLPVAFVVVKDRDGKRREPMVGTLLSQAAFLRHWNDKKTSSGV